MDVIASWRAQGYLSYLQAAGFEPVLVSMRWQPDGSGGWRMHDKHALTYIEELPQGGRIVRLPRVRSLASKVHSFFARVPLFRQVFIVCAWLCGHLDATEEQWDCYCTYKRFLYQHVKEARYVSLIAIFSPHHHLRLATRLHKRFGLPYVLDFRDLWNTRLVSATYRPNFKNRFQDMCCSKYWARWLEHAAFFTITSSSWKRYLYTLTGTQGRVLRNGYEPAHFMHPPPTRTERFVLLHCGSLYRHQALGNFVEGIRRFIEEVQPKYFDLRFIGAEKGKQPASSTAYLSTTDVHTLLQPVSSVLQLWPRHSKAACAKYMQAAEVLLMPTFPTHAGVYSAKVFDYLAAKRPILLTPDDKGLLAALINARKAGTVASTAEEVHCFFKTAYSDWLKNGRYPFLGQETGLKCFSRQYQVSRMGKYLNTMPSPA